MSPQHVVSPHAQVEVVLIHGRLLYDLLVGVHAGHPLPPADRYTRAGGGDNHGQTDVVSRCNGQGEICTGGGLLTEGEGGHLETPTTRSCLLEAGGEVLSVDCLVMFSVTEHASRGEVDFVGFTFGVVRLKGGIGHVSG